MKVGLMGLACNLKIVANDHVFDAENAEKRKNEYFHKFMEFFISPQIYKITLISQRSSWPSYLQYISGKHHVGDSNLASMVLISIFLVEMSVLVSISLRVTYFD